MWILLMLVVALFVAAFLVALLLFVMSQLRPRVPAEVGGGWGSRGDDSGLSPVFQIARWGAIAYAVVIAVMVLVEVAGAFAPDLTIEIPVNEFWPVVDPRITIYPGDATIVGGGFTSATLTLAGVSTTVRVLSAIAALLTGGMHVTIALAIAAVFRHVKDSRPFTEALAKFTAASAVAVACGAVVAQIVRGIAGTKASMEALDIGGWSAESVDEFLTDPGLPGSGFFVEFQFAPLGVVLALAALAVLFSRATRLQRDNEGLV